MNNPYEYHENKLGVQGRFLFSGDKIYEAHKDSLCLIGYKGFASRISRGQITRIRLQGPNTPMLVAFDSLPHKWQELIVKTWGPAPKRVRQSEFDKLYIRDMEAFNFYSMFRFADEVSLDNDKVDEYTLNASVLNTAERFRQACYKLRRSLRGEVSPVWSIVTNEVNRCKLEYGHTLPENEDYLRRIFNRYKKESYKSLISGKHKNVNARKVFDETDQLLNNVFSGMESKPNVAEVYEMYDAFLDGYVEIINESTGELYDPKDFKKLSEGTVRNWLNKWKNQIGTHGKRSGDRQKFMQRFKPYHSLDQSEFAGSIISIDDRQPVFEYPIADGGTRMWFYNGIDLGSEAFTCWVYGKSKEGIILDFYRQMVRNYAEWGINLPAELEGESALNASFKDTFLKEGNMFQHVRIEANNARGKRIERYYGNLRYQYEKKREGWLARPFAISEANQAGPQKKKLIPYNDIVEGCLQDITKWNNSPHSKIKGMSRWDVFLSMQHKDVRPTNYHGILPYLGYVTETSVHAGIIRFRNTEFLLGMDGVVAVGDRLVNLMMQAENRDITIYWLDDNYGNVLKAHVYIGNQFICEAVEKPRYKKARIEQTPQDLLNRELMSKYVATIEGFGQRQRKQLDNVIIIGERPVTIGNSFTMPGMSKTIISDEPAKVLADIDEEEDYLNTNKTHFKSALKDRF